MKQRLTYIALAVMILATAVLGVKLYGANEALAETNEVLAEYKLVYDGLTVYEDGSWVYDEGVEEYWFWNWDLEHVGNKAEWVE